ncbi:MAG: hypothetical protein KDJ68_14540 [Rhodobiaceae bacterium]|nr:hypothetical protein [Rhodobiaceae bacterium]MCC0041062.1 hypothetical protein [Rhodobiaceae bacterium]
MAKSSGGGKNFRSAKTGQFVTESFANSHKATTLGEARGGGSTGGTHRSAKTGQFVTDGYAKRHPSTTIKDS